MDEKFLKELETKLEKSKKEIISELEKFASKDKKIKDDWETKYPKFDDGVDSKAIEGEADEVEEYANLLPVEHSLELQLRDINLALTRIRNGKDYGRCEKCGREISKERLRAYPEARLCGKCENK